MIKTGIDITLQDNVSQNARTIKNNFDDVAKSADGVSDSFNTGNLDEFNTKLNQIGESYKKLNEQMGKRQSGQRAVGAGMMSAAGGGATQAMGGDVVGGGIKAGTGILSALGGGGLALGALAMGIGVAHKGSEGHQARVGGYSSVAGMSGNLGSSDLTVNSNKLRAALADMVDSVTKYGKTFEEGTQAQAQYLKSGGKNFGGSASAIYSNVYGADYNALASFEGQGERYGEGRGLQAVGRSLKAQGLGNAQFEEVMGGIQGSFQSMLSKGIVKPMEEIARNQSFFSGAGETWKGGMGAQKVQGMDQAVASASQLGGQSDIMMYRAAAKLSGGSMLETKKLMEGGMTPELFKGLIGEYDKMGYGEEESILQLSKQMGLSVTDAESLYKMKDEDAKVSGYFEKGLSTKAGMTKERDMIGMQERVKQNLMEEGSGVFDLEYATMKAGEVTIEGIGDAVDKLAKDLQPSDESLEKVKTSARVKSQVVSQETPESRMYKEIKERASKGQKGYGSIMAKIESSGLSDEDLSGLEHSYGKATKSGRNDKAGNLTKTEESMLLKKLDELIGAVLSPTTVESE